MVAALLELHHHVDEPSDAALDPFTQGTVVLGQYPPRGRTRTQYKLYSVVSYESLSAHK